MTDVEFERRVSAIIASESGHNAHRALDLLTNELLVSMGGGFARGTEKWLAAIEGDHAPGQPYPLRGRLGRRWSAEEYAQAVRLHGEGLSHHIVGKRLGRSGQAVRRALQRRSDLLEAAAEQVA